MQFWETNLRLDTCALSLNAKSQKSPSCAPRAFCKIQTLLPARARTSSERWDLFTSESHLLAPSPTEAWPCLDALRGVGPHLLLQTIPPAQLSLPSLAAHGLARWTRSSPEPPALRWGRRAGGCQTVSACRRLPRRSVGCNGQETDLHCWTHRLPAGTLPQRVPSTPPLLHPTAVSWLKVVGRWNRLRRDAVEVFKTHLHPGRGSENVCMWHLGTWFSRRGGDGVTVGLHPRGLSQP